VALTLSGTLPPGSTYSFSSPIITGGVGISTLTIAVPSGLTPGTSYVSFVTVSAASGTIAKSQTIALSIDTPAPPPPAQHTVHLAWNASPTQVAGYLVYRSTVSGTGYSLLNVQPISGLSYDDSTVASGTTYYYVVTAVSASGEQSPYSNMATAVVPSP
jgi:fibronectin type 3 domain-containing protein